ncbi:flagellar basal body protein [Butyrivibrio sp. FCS014]|uniref:flagellar basal body protein n=1 Tax=Butyrivibrio sp. FCS014 TaxID=1408304 RepID=UPI0004643D44|nr:flagellar basal body protein [Butyrivibrio sp. FCS014]
MVSQFFGLNIAASGLRAANAALNTTANNISNANTDGYSRQQVKQEATDALRVFATYGCAGAGVDTLAIERVRDSFYDVKFRNNETLLGEVSQKNYYNGLIEDYLNDDGTTGFSSLFNKMEAAMESSDDSCRHNRDQVSLHVQLKECYRVFQQRIRQHSGPSVRHKL